MTDNEIIKALECCIKSSHFGECFENECPFISEQGCRVGKETLYPYAFDLINRQKAEIERITALAESADKKLYEALDYRAEKIRELEAEIERWQGGYMTQKQEIANLEIELKAMRGAANSYKAEIERLKKCRKEEVEKLMTATDKVICEAKAEAYKEFAERLKEKYNKPAFYLGSYEQFMGEVDNLLKEMVGAK